MGVAKSLQKYELAVGGIRYRATSRENHCVFALFIRPCLAEGSLPDLLGRPVDASPHLGPSAGRHTSRGAREQL